MRQEAIRFESLCYLKRYSSSIAIALLLDIVPTKWMNTSMCIRPLTVLQQCNCLNRRSEVKRTVLGEALNLCSNFRFYKAAFASINRLLVPDQIVVESNLAFIELKKMFHC